MAGYSAKPLWRKLGFDASAEVLLIDAPAGWSIPGMPQDVSVARESGAAPGDAPAAAIIAFFVALAGLGESLAGLAARIFPAGAVWIAWPRRAGGHDSDIREQDIREQALALGLVDVKVAALDEDWSGLRLVWRREHRGAPASARR
jgi:hypothetical protein